MVRQLAAKDKYRIELIRNDEQWTVRVQDVGTSEVASQESRPQGIEIALFPAQISLLRAVLTGMSYQIAGDHGSLNLSNSGGHVGLTAHLESGYRLIVSIPSEKFANAIEELSRE